MTTLSKLTLAEYKAYENLKAVRKACDTIEASGSELCSLEYGNLMHARSVHRDAHKKLNDFCDAINLH